MKKWKLTLNVSDLWRKAENRELPVDEFKQLLHKKLTSFTSKVDRFIGSDGVYEYTELVDELDYSEFDDYDDFDYWLSSFYNFCDANRIWLETYSPVS
jgi:hypothetical protein